MFNSTYLFIVSILVLFTLLLRDLPYINVAIIGKMWIIYLLILLVVVLSIVRFKYAYVLIITSALFVFAFILTVLTLPFFADIVGVLIYFSFWILLVHAMTTVRRKKP